MLSRPENRLGCRDELQDSDREHLEINESDEPSGNRADNGAVCEVSDSRADCRIHAAEQSDFGVDEDENLLEESADGENSARDSPEADRYRLYNPEDSFECPFWQKPKVDPEGISFQI